MYTHNVRGSCKQNKSENLGVLSKTYSASNSTWRRIRKLQSSKFLLEFHIKIVVKKVRLNHLTLNDKLLFLMRGNIMGCKK